MAGVEVGLLKSEQQDIPNSVCVSCFFYASASGVWLQSWFIVMSGTRVGGTGNPQCAQSTEEEFCAPVVLKQSKAVHLRHVRNPFKDV